MRCAATGARTDRATQSPATRQTTGPARRTVTTQIRLLSTHGLPASRSCNLVEILSSAKTRLRQDALVGYSAPHGHHLMIIDEASVGPAGMSTDDIECIDSMTALLQSVEWSEEGEEDQAGDEEDAGGEVVASVAAVHLTVTHLHSTLQWTRGRFREPSEIPIRGARRC